MKYLYSAARILLGLIFVIFGLNGFLTFISVPDFHPFMEILVNSGYIYVIKTLEVVGGILLLINRCKGIALLLLGPIVFNILLYHLLLDPRNWLISIVNSVCYSVLFWEHRQLFAPLFKEIRPPYRHGLYKD